MVYPNNQFRAEYIKDLPLAVIEVGVLGILNNYDEWLQANYVISLRPKKNEVPPPAPVDPPENLAPDIKASPIEIGKDGRCKCHAGTGCVLGRVASELRCTKEELNAEGFTTST